MQRVRREKSGKKEELHGEIIPSRVRSRRVRAFAGALSAVSP
jgi:hypothetical protein